jgi:hypothetical protein
MAVNIQHPDLLTDGDLPGTAGPKLGWFGLFLLPVALPVYVVAMPFFALFWLIDWCLPLGPHNANSLSSGPPARALRTLGEDSPSH